MLFNFKDFVFHGIINKWMKLLVMVEEVIVTLLFFKQF